MKVSSRIGLAVVVLLLVIQFLSVEKNENGYESVALFEEETKANAEIKAILKAHCYDCHSGQTRYPWYAEIAPVSFWLDHHIEEGHEHLDLTNWADYTSEEKEHKLEELVEEVTEEEMPLQSYTWLHGKLNDHDKQLLVQWATAAKDL